MITDSMFFFKPYKLQVTRVTIEHKNLPKLVRAACFTLNLPRKFNTLFCKGKHVYVGTSKGVVTIMLSTYLGTLRCRTGEGMAGFVDTPVVNGNTVDK